MNSKIQLSVSVVLLGALLSGCFSVPSEESSPSEQSVTDPRVAKESLKAAIRTSVVEWIGAMDEVIVRGATAKSIERIVDESQESHDQNSSDDFNLEEVKRELDRGLDLLFVNEQVERGEIRYTPGSRFCREVAAKNHPEACIEVFTHVSFVQIPQSEFRGILKVQYDHLTPVVLTYDIGQGAIEVEVSQLYSTLQGAFSIIEQIDGREEGDPLFNDRGKGKLRLDIQRFSENSLRLNVAVLEDVVFGGNFGEKDIRLEIGKSSRLLELSIDRFLQRAALKLDVFQVMAKFEIFDENEVKRNAHLQIGNLNLDLSLDNLLEQIQVGNLSIAQNQAEVTVEGERAIGLQFQPVGFSLDASGAALEFTLQKEINASVELNNVYGVFTDGENEEGENFTTGSLSLVSQAGTKVYLDQSNVVQSRDADIQLLGTGGFEGSVEIQGMGCFEILEDQQGMSFPFRSLECDI